MTPPVPLGDDWLYWDPQAVASYPHSSEPVPAPRPPEQLELWDAATDAALAPPSPRGGGVGTG